MFCKQIILMKKYDPQRSILLKPIVSQYRKDSWTILLKAALQLALKCAYLVAYGTFKSSILRISQQ